jgi:hypothetical protein
MSTTNALWTLDLEAHARPVASSDSVSPEENNNARWRQARRKLVELRRLKANWDGLGGEASDPAVVDWAVEYLSSLGSRGPMAPPDRIILGPDGAVVIEWQVGGERIQAEICEVGRVEWMHSRPRGSAIHWTESPDELYGELDWDTGAHGVAGGAASVYA